MPPISCSMSCRRSAPPVFTFLDDEVIFGRDPLRDLKDWDWGRRLVAAGIQRLEFERKVSRDEFESFLEEILARLTLVDDRHEREPADAVARHSLRRGRRAGPVRRAAAAATAPLATMTSRSARKPRRFAGCSSEVQSRRGPADGSGSRRAVPVGRHAQRSPDGPAPASAQGVRSVHDHALTERGGAGDGPGGTPGL